MTLTGPQSAANISRSPRRRRTGHAAGQVDNVPSDDIIVPTSSGPRIHRDRVMRLVQDLTTLRRHGDDE